MSAHETILFGEKAGDCKEVINAAIDALKAKMVAHMLGFSVAQADEAEVISMHKSISLIDAVRAGIDEFITSGTTEAFYARQARAAEQDPE